MADGAARVPALADAVYYHFRECRIDGRLRRAYARLREAVREAVGSERDPSAAVIDSQVVKTTPVGEPEQRGGRLREVARDRGGDDLRRDEQAYAAR